MGYKVGMPTLKLNAQRSEGGRHGNIKAIIGEAFPWDGKQTRWCGDEDFSPEKSHFNRYEGFQYGKDVYKSIMDDIKAYDKELEAQGKRARRVDAVLAEALIIKYPKELYETLDEGQRAKLFEDGDSIMKDFLGSNFKASATHFDEGVPHTHYIAGCFSEDGRLCGSKLYNLKFYSRLNKEFPERMRSLGWDGNGLPRIDDAATYDPEAVKSMTDEEKEAYKKEHINRKKQRKKAGCTAKEYKAKKKLENAYAEMFSLHEDMEAEKFIHEQEVLEMKIEKHLEKEALKDIRQDTQNALELKLKGKKQLGELHSQVRDEQAKLGLLEAKAAELERRERELAFMDAENRKKRQELDQLEMELNRRSASLAANEEWIDTMTGDYLALEDKVRELCDPKLEKQAESVKKQLAHGKAVLELERKAVKESRVYAPADMKNLPPAVKKLLTDAEEIKMKRLGRGDMQFGG